MQTKVLNYEIVNLFRKHLWHRLIPYLLVLALLMVSRSAFAAPAKTEEEEKEPKSDARPNFLVFMTDDESAFERGIYGWSGLETPAFDRVAKSGVLFSRAFASAPSCAPSRAAVVTGRNFWELEQGAFIQGYLPSKFEVLPQLLEKAGYQIGWTGKSVGPYQLPSDPPKPDRHHPDTVIGKKYNDIRFTPEEEQEGIWIVDYVSNFDAFLKDRNPDQPFWFWVGVSEPHYPQSPTNVAKLEEKYGITTDQIKVRGDWPDTEGLRRHHASVAYEILYADEALGRILEKLEAMGELENTFIIITSDNGSEPPRAKTSPYELGCHVPMAISWPGKIKPGRVVDNLVALQDLAPTMLEAAGQPVPPEMTAQSLMPLLLSDRSGVIEPWRTSLVTGLEWHAELPPHNRAFRTIRDNNFAYIVNYGDGWPREPKAKPPERYEADAKTMRNPEALVIAYPDHPDLARIAPFILEKRPAEELYDLKNDPWQLKDLAQDPAHAETKARLKAQLEDYQRETGDPRITGEMDIFNATRELVIERKKSNYAF